MVAMRSIAVGVSSNDRSTTHRCPWSLTTGRRWTTHTRRSPIQIARPKADGDAARAKTEGPGAM